MKYVIQTTSDDKVKVHAYKAWDDLIYETDPDLDFEINEKISRICEFRLQSESNTHEESHFFKKHFADAQNVLGLLTEAKGDMPTALAHHQASLKMGLELNDPTIIGNSYNNIGILYNDISDTSRALEYYNLAIPFREQMEDYNGLANLQNNIAVIYQKGSAHARALDLLDESLSNFRLANNPRGIAMVTFNIGLSYEGMSQFDSAMYYYISAEEQSRINNDKIQLMNVLDEMSVVSITKADSAEKKGDLGEFRKLSKEAKQYAEEALGLALEYGILKKIETSAKHVGMASNDLGEYKDAYSAMHLAYNAKDSIEILGDRQAVLELQFQYQYDLKTERDSLKREEERKVTAERLEKERTQRYALWGGIGLLVLFGAFIFNRFRKSQRQKAIIEEQKEVVEEQHQEILDSINYAKRIQAAILPPAKIVDKYLPDSFILYLPKDVVAGDFYWLQHVGDEVLFAAADCTGHGVPGAMVSVVCNNALNRSVKEFGLTDPGKILDKTREIVIDEFSKSEENVQDGMDVALCHLAGLKLRYAGAQNPLWILRDGAIIETKGDKQPVGKYDHQKNFQTHEFDLKTGDMIYLFSDGYVDQFGGPKGKKFKAKALKEIILKNANHSMTEQRENLLQAFNEWKERYEQVDDVCVIGVRV